MPKILEKYPNLQAVLQGTVSGQVTEWIMIRRELRDLIIEYEDELNSAYVEIDSYRED